MHATADRTTALAKAMRRLRPVRGDKAQAAPSFLHQPEPRLIGSYARGKQLSAGQFQFAGALVEAPGTSIWDLPAPDAAFSGALHGFGWLDDLAAVDDAVTRARAQDWTFDWIVRFGAGAGQGWAPDLTGRRLTRWINHSLLLLNGVGDDRTGAYFHSLAAQTTRLARSWKTAAPGLPRFEALTGLLAAALTLSGAQAQAAPACAALAQECATVILPDGGIATRNPDELLQIFALLTGAVLTLREADHPAPQALTDAVRRMAPLLRALRHADGGLARFHGGGRGGAGVLDQALAQVEGRAETAHGLAMGYARLNGGATSLILDAAPPPQGAASRAAHASTLAFEMTSGRRPLIVNCGSGVGLGPEWALAGRATPAQSTLCIRGYSSARLARGASGELGEGPDQVWAQEDRLDDGARLLAGHNGYASTHGLTHMRDLTLSVDGRLLTGQDRVAVTNSIDKRRFDRLMRRRHPKGIEADLHFHLHPDIDATLDLGGSAVSMALKNGEIWVFRHDGVGELRLLPSVYLEPGQIRPRPSRQIVISVIFYDTSCQIGWTLTKAQDTPQGKQDSSPDP